jgi:hypothetical protein
MKDCQWVAEKITSFIKLGEHKESWESQLSKAILVLIWSVILQKLWRIYYSYQKNSPRYGTIPWKAVKGHGILRVTMLFASFCCKNDFFQYSFFHKSNDSM